MTYTHLRDLIVKYKGDKKYVLERIQNEKLVIVGKWYVKDWAEPYFPSYAPADEYLNLINRLDGQHFEFKGKPCKTESRVESSGRIYTSLIFEDGASINYQNQKAADRRSCLHEGVPLEMFDVSASQLRVALALRGRLLPFHESPWDDLVEEVKHDELNEIDHAAKRRFVKRVALMAVKRIRNPDITTMWNEEVRVPPKVSRKGLKSEIERALYKVYPELKEDIPSTTKTPDGYTIQQERSRYQLAVKCRPLGVDTKYFIPIYGAPTENNIVEAYEACILRNVIFSLPKGAPILTCHDEVSTHAPYIPVVQSSWESALNELARLC
jgi:hypothetical protein